MPRNPQGLYTLPLPPVQSGELIESSWANTTLDDLASAMTASLPRDGTAPMTGQLTLVDQTANPPLDPRSAISLGYFDGQLENIQTGASGGAGNPIVFENDRFATVNYTITNGKNGMTAGPFSINAGVTVGVPAGSNWTIVGGTGSTSGPTPAFSDNLPIMDGVAAPGISTMVPRADHVHPSDTTRAPITSPSFLGIPTAVTAANGTNTTQLATCAFVLANAGGGGSVPSDATPTMAGVGDPGVSTTYSRGDHVHPSDTTKAPLASPAFTGFPTAPTVGSGDNSTRIATTAFVASAVTAAGGLLPSNNLPVMDGAASAGVGTAASRDDHRHPTDTTRAPLVSPTFTGSPAAPTATAGDSSTLLATTAFVAGAVATGSGTALQKTQNLADLQNVTTARANLGLSTKAQFDAACTDGDFAYTAANTFSGVQTFGAATVEKSNAVAASNIDCSLGSIYSKTISGATTLTVSNVAASGNVTSFLLDLTNGGSATITWWSGMKWAGGSAPSLTAAGRDVLGFFTYNGGTTWTGLLLGKDVK